MSEEKNKVEKVVKTATEKIKEIKGNQVTGEKIINEKGQSVIPVSDLTVAVFSGGGEYGKIIKDKNENFAGGCAVVCTLKPNSFIIDNGNGYEITKANNIIDNLNSITEKVSKLIKR